MSKSSSGWNAHAAIERYDAGAEAIPDRHRLGSMIVLAIGCICAAAMLIGGWING